jgi:HEAT repeat protein
MARLAKTRGVEAKLTRLHALRNEPALVQHAEELRKLLEEPSNLVVAEAAAVIGGSALKELAPALEAAFDRLMIDPEGSDKYCRGKIALIEALNNLEYTEPGVFLRGIVHVQDPVWGAEPGQDAAGPLRAHCAFGLARINHPDLLLILTDLLLDSDNAARTGAARALGGSGSLAAIPLLRYKARLGDREPEIMGECFAALLTLSPTTGLPFVAGFLKRGNSAVQEAAAFALAESRRPEAFTSLKDFWPQAPSDLRESVLLAVAMLRLPAALDFLVDIVRRKDPNSCAALSALAIHRHQIKVRENAAAAVAANGEPRVQQWFRMKFPVAPG